MKTDYFPSQPPHFRPARAHFPSPLLLFLCSSHAIAHTRIRLFSVFIFTSSPSGAKHCATAHYRVKKLQQFAFTFYFTSCKQKANSSKNQHLQKPTQRITTQAIERVKAISQFAFTLILFIHKKIIPFGEEVNIKVENDWTRPREVGVFAKGLAKTPWQKVLKIRNALSHFGHERGSPRKAVLQLSTRHDQHHCRQA